MKKPKHKYVYPIKNGYLVKFTRGNIVESIYIGAGDYDALQVAIGVRDDLLAFYGLESNA